MTKNVPILKPGNKYNISVPKWVAGKTRGCGLRVLRGSNGWNAGDCCGETPRFTRRSSSLKSVNRNGRLVSDILYKILNLGSKKWVSTALISSDTRKTSTLNRLLAPGIYSNSSDVAINVCVGACDVTRIWSQFECYPWDISNCCQNSM